MSKRINLLGFQWIWLCISGSLTM